MPRNGNTPTRKDVADLAGEGDDSETAQRLGHLEVRRAGAVPFDIVALVDAGDFRFGEAEVVREVSADGVGDGHDMVETGMEVGEPRGGIPAREVADRAAVADDLHARETNRGAQNGGEGLVDRGVDHVARTAPQFAAEGRRGGEVESVAELDHAALRAAVADARNGGGVGVGRVEEGEPDAEARQFGVDVGFGQVRPVRHNPDVWNPIHG